MQSISENTLPQGYDVDALRKKLMLGRHPVWFVLLGIVTLEVYLLLWLYRLYTFVAAWDRSGKFSVKFWMTYTILSNIFTLGSYVLLDRMEAMRESIPVYGNMTDAYWIIMGIVLGGSLLIMIVDIWLYMRCLKILGGRLQEQGFIYVRKPVSTAIFYTLFRTLYLHYRLRQCLLSKQEAPATN